MFADDADGGKSKTNILPKLVVAPPLEEAASGEGSPKAASGKLQIFNTHS